MAPVSARTARLPATVVSSRANTSVAGDPSGPGTRSANGTGSTLREMAIPADSVSGGTSKGSGWKNRHRSACPGSLVDHVRG